MNEIDFALGALSVGFLWFVFWLQKKHNEHSSKEEKGE